MMSPPPRCAGALDDLARRARIAARDRELGPRRVHESRVLARDVAVEEGDRLRDERLGGGERTATGVQPHAERDRRDPVCIGLREFEQMRQPPLRLVPAPDPDQGVGQVDLHERAVGGAEADLADLVGRPDEHGDGLLDAAVAEERVADAPGCHRPVVDAAQLQREAPTVAEVRDGRFDVTAVRVQLAQHDPGPRLLLARAGRAGGRERLVDPRAEHRQARAVRADADLADQRGGALGGRPRRQERERRLEVRQREIGTDVPAPEAFVEARGANRIGVLVQLGKRVVGDRDRRICLARELGDVGEVREQARHVASGRTVRRCDACPELPGAREMALRIREGVGELGRVGGRERRRECRRIVVGGVEMKGERRPLRRAAFVLRDRRERRRHAGVEVATLARQQVLVDRVAGKRVPEAVALVSVVAREDVGLDELPQRRREPRLLETRRPPQQVVVDRRADRRRERDELAGVG